MSVLVTGGAGYIGSHLAWRLLEAGEKVVVMDNLSNGTRSVVPAEAIFIEADVADRDKVAQTLRIHEVNAVFHLAASTGVGASLQDPLGYYANNFAATCNLVAECRRAGIGDFVFASTAAVYMPEAGCPVSEDFKPAPASPYGTSKLFAERMLEDVSQVAGDHFRHVVLRFFNVAGTHPEGKCGYTGFGLPTAFEIALQTAYGKREKMHIFGADYQTRDGTCERDFVHVWDLCEANIAALRHLRAGGSNLLVNCGSGTGTTVRELVAAVEKASGRKVPLQDSARRDGDLVSVVADVSRISGELDWQPERSSMDVIAGDAVRWAARNSVQM